MMKFNLRVDESNTTHVHCTLFTDGANCGRLTFRQEEYGPFARTLLMGSLRMPSSVNVSAGAAVMASTAEKARRQQ
jgi:hypothetical protein